ncbi:MAG: P-type DNA transfer ATPase VirB11 [Rickettsiales bacterium]|nr:P-type DNA transfer ATPase VirB11 [Rickettsiales bacterium]
MSTGSITALETFLGPLKAFFDRDGITEISINRPGEIWIEEYGSMVYHPIPEFDFDHLRSMGHLVAQSTNQMVSEEKPLLSATLPDGYRIQVVFPPACEPNTVAMSIRKQTVLNLDLEQYEAIGAFEGTIVKKEANEDDIMLRKLLNQGNIREFLSKAVKLRRNMIVSGGTSTGKTTFMNATLKEIPVDERILTIEDAREVNIEHIPNRVHLVASRGEQGRAQVTAQDLIEASLRLRPDRIVLGELRGKEAFTYLRAINTGHPGSITTLHADSPALAIEQLILMIMQANLGLKREEIKDYVEQIVNVIVQLKRGAKGKRYVSEVYFKELI